MVKQADNGLGHGISLTMQEKLVSAMQSAGFFDHPVDSIEMHETHISWVILAGEFAYKIKKSVDFGFLDFSTLQKRHFFCEEELRLNHRFAPQLYLDVVKICGTVDAPVLNGSGEPLEYAVRMRRFPQADLLENLAATGQLTAGHIDRIATLLAGIHAGVARAGAESEFGRVPDIHHWVMENFSHIRSALRCEQCDSRLDDLEVWCRRELEAIRGHLEQRRKGGFIRECHGDLHLGNLALVNGEITPFDCLEFNPKLRWIDVMSEAAFLVMDLQDRGYPEMAYRFLNRYLQDTGDHEGLRVLGYYLVYRALVRAKVAALRYAQSGTQAADSAAALGEYEGYINLATSWVTRPKPFMAIMHGVSGSGKSWLASRLAERAGAIMLRSDVERKRLFGLEANARTDSGVHAGIYSRAASERTYARLEKIADSVLASGLPVIVDAAFLKQDERLRFRRLAEARNVRFGIVHMEVAEPVLVERIRKRSMAGSDPSEAGIAVLQSQLASQELLSRSEMAAVAIVEGDQASSPGVLQRILQHIRSGEPGTAGSG